VGASMYFENVMTVRDVEVRGKRVLLRVDFNVPLKDGKVADDFRIRAALPTIQYVIQNGGKPIVMSHLGRPKGKRVESLSLKPVADTLAGLIGRKVTLAPDCVGPEVERLAMNLGTDEILLLENTRFHPEETSNDLDFAKKLASLGEIYVNDAFGAAHRAHASTEGVARFLKPAVAGFLMEKEINFLGRLLASPERPFVAIIGGAKISGKIEILKNLASRVEAMLIGGGIANTLLKAEGYDVGGSLVEDEALDIAHEIVDVAREHNVELVIPDDFIVADRVESGAARHTISRPEPVPEGESIVDIGPRSIERFRDVLSKAKTIFWNGPVGVFEIEDFAEGTIRVAEAVAEATRGGAVSVIGGGDTASAVAKAGIKDAFTHVSTGGGASLEFVGGKELPGIAILTKRETS